MIQFSRLLLICSFCLTFLQAIAQSKKPLSHDVYDSWKSIQSKEVSGNGKWVQYTLQPDEGDPLLYLHDLNARDDNPLTLERAYGGKFSEDSKYLVCRIKSRADTLKLLRRKKMTEDKLPKDSLLIIPLEQDTLIYLPRVRSFQLPEKGNNWLAVHLETQLPVKPVVKDTSSAGDEKKDRKTTGKDLKTDLKGRKNTSKKEPEEKKEEAPKDTVELSELDKANLLISELNEKIKKFENEKAADEARKKKKAPKKENKDNGTILLLCNLLTSKKDTFPFVTEYLMAKKANKIAFVSTGNDSTFKAGVYVYDMEKETLLSVYPKAGKHKTLAWDEEGTQLAFFSDPDTSKAHQKAQIKHFDLIYWQEKQKTAAVMANQTTPGISKNWMIQHESRLFFSKDGSKLFFSTSPQPLVKDTTLLDEEIVTVDVWHWKDGKIQPHQLNELKNINSRSYLSVVYPKTKKISQLAAQDMPGIALSQDYNADFALGWSGVPYERAITWEGSGMLDLYFVNLKDGSRRPVKKKIRASNFGVSPGGLYLHWYAPLDSAWMTYSSKTGMVNNLTKAIPGKFYDEFNDVPDAPGSYGLMGWAENDQNLLVNDRFDIWMLDPENKRPATRLTKNGRENKLKYRYIKLDPEETAVKPAQTLLLHTTDEESKAEGYFTTTLASAEAPRKLLLNDHHYGNPMKAKEANRYVFTQENFSEFPDLYHSDFSFTKIKKISEANPQQARYLWGTAELVKFNGLNGEELEGLLYKPENFDPGKKYPMIVYYYERLSDELHTYISPVPHRSSMRASFYTSNGYLVFMPDITYRIGAPGESAYDAIIAGVNHLLQQGFVDKDKIGLQGHSWGGYQTVYLITRTPMFAAAVAGAPVANMTSAYGGIRWESGLSRMFQYERSQSRLGATLWEKPFLYLENSPLFKADKIETPLLMMHNDKDGAVPWYQGIEMYMALRRLNKPVWLLNYNEEPHWVLKKQNQRDYARRMQQFFDYYLKFTPQPLWMKEGVPAGEKSIRLRHELANE